MAKAPAIELSFESLKELARQFLNLNRDDLKRAKAKRDELREALERAQVEYETSVQNESRAQAMFKAITEASDQNQGSNQPAQRIE